MIWRDPFIRDALKGLAILILLPTALRLLAVAYVLTFHAFRGEDKP